MVLHPELKKFFDSLPKSDPDQEFKIIPEEARKDMNKPSIPLEEREQVHHVEDRTVSTEQADLNIRIYTPEEKESYPLLVYFHGGAFFSGNLESHDEVARPIAKYSGYKVIAVDYRLAPEHPYPAALEDAYNITKWATEHKEELKWDGKNLAVAGDSAGGNLAAAVSFLARDKKEFEITKQILYYPSLDLDFDINRYPSYMENRRGYGVETDMLPEFNSFYLSGGADPTDSLVSPKKQTNLKDLPEALIVTAEHDPMRDEGELFAKNLEEAGVSVELKRYDGVVHGFLGKWTHLVEYKEVYDRTGRFLNQGI